MKAFLIFADSELELVPDGPEEHYSFASLQHFRDIPVLDSFFHASLIKDMPDGDRRGRPDLVHRALCLCQNSIPNYKGVLSVFVHTRNDRVIAVDPSVDIRPNYVDFLQQMGKLLRGASVPGYTLSAKTLKELVEEIKADHVVALTPSGEEKDLAQLFGNMWKDDRVIIIIGAFPKGDYRSPVYALADTKVSLGSHDLTPSSVVGEVLAALPCK